MRHHRLVLAIRIVCILWIGALFLQCKPDPSSQGKLEVVSYAQFEEFVQATAYQTDAEKYGWSVVQQDVFSFQVATGATWKKPDGIHPPSSKNLPVTQVSYNDAMAYCRWSNTKLPTYEEYWEKVNADQRKVVTDHNASISEVNEVNIVGNVWEITSTVKGSEVRLAGGSVFCSPKTCDGTSKTRELYVDKQTGNIHIGFAVVK